MAFLKKRPDGLYEPVSGQLNPFLAVKRVIEPLTDDVDALRSLQKHLQKHLRPR